MVADGQGVSSPRESFVSYEYRGREAEYEEEIEDDEPESRFWVSALVCLVLVASGSGAAFAWHGYGVGELITGALSVSPKPVPAAQLIAAQDALLKSLAEAQQRETAIAQQNQQMLQAQGAELKRLSDTVSQLAARVDALNARNAQAFAPPPAPKKPAAAHVVAHKPAAAAPLSLAPAAEEKK